MVTSRNIDISQMLLSTLALIQMLVPKVATAIEKRLEQGDSPEAILRELVRSLGEASDGKELAHLWLALSHLAEGRNESALDEFSAARQAWPDGNPILQFLEAHAFLSLHRYDEAFSSFAASHEWLWLIFDSLQGAPALAPGIQQRKEDFYARWALPGLAQGIEGLVIPSRKDWKAGAEKVAAVLRQAQKEGKEDAVWSVVTQVKESLPPEFQHQVQEFGTFIELIAIEDPFEGLRVLARSISAVWPKDVDCVEAVREQRR